MTVTIPTIQRIVCEHFGVGRGNLLGPSRKSQFAQPRMISMILCKEFTGASLSSIGRMHGGKHHTTALHAWRDYRPVMEAEGQLTELRAKIASGWEPKEPVVAPALIRIPPSRPKPPQSAPEPKRSPRAPVRAVLLPSEITPSRALLCGGGREWAATAKPYGGSGRRSAYAQAVGGG